MSLLLLFAYPNPASIPITELVQTEPSPSNGFVTQRDAVTGEWRFVLELADPADGDSAIWRDISGYYAGDRHQMGADEYLGKARARLVTVQLQIDDSDMLAPWGQDTSSIFGTDVRLDAGLLMRASMTRIVSGVVAEWQPLWTGRVESWGDQSEALGQIRKHIVSVVDTMSDLANVPTYIGGTESFPWDTWFTSRVLPAAGWLFGVDIYGDTSSSSLLGDQLSTAAINRMDQGTDPLGLVWRTLRSGRMVIHPAPWDTTNTNRYTNPLLDTYPDGLRFNWSPDTTDIEYIDGDDQESFGVQRTVAGIANSVAISYPDGFDTAVYQVDDPVSIGRYGVRPYQATWIVAGTIPQGGDDILASRAYANAQALPLRTTLDLEGFFPAMAIVDHLDPVTIIHATRPDGLVVTATGTIRNIVEERTYIGQSADGSDIGLTWQTTVQIDIDATETSAALLPVENLALVSTTTGSSGPSSAEFSWDNPVQPDITPTEVQLRLLGRSPVWFPKDYPGVGADGTTIGFLEAATAYTLQVRLVRRVNGIIVAFSAVRSLDFTTAARIWPIPIPGTDPTDTDVDMPPFDDCEDDVSIQLQENDGTGWVTVDTFSGAEIEQGDDGHWHLVDDIPNSFFNSTSMYRFLGFCGDDLIVTGPPFTVPADWTDPCSTPSSLSDPPYSDASLLVYVPQICAPDTIREYVSGIAGVHGDALDAIITGLTDPDAHALLALADPLWSAAPGGILAYGECPQIVGHTGDATIGVRTNIADNTSCVLGECAGMQITASPGSGSNWVAGATITTVDGVVSLISDDLPVNTSTLVFATFDAETGDVALFVDDAAVDSDSIGTATTRINALPIWRVGAPPESWVTDFAVWDSVLNIATGPPMGGLVAWWDAADTSSIASSGGVVSQWNDKSGNGYHLTVPGGQTGPQTGTRTKNGLNVVDYTGDVLYNSPVASSNPMTMFVVCVQDTTPASPFISTVAYFDGAAETGIRITSTAAEMVSTVGGASVITGAAYPNGTWRLITGEHKGGGQTMSLWENGALQGTATPAGGPSLTDPFVTGARATGNRPLDGAIAEILIYRPNLTSAERALVEAYLTAKWDIP